MADTIKVFVGCAANNEDLESQAVLEWSIRKHASQPVDIVWMQLSNDPESFFSGWNTRAWATPFSGFRWSVPEQCDFMGKAIYTDSDVMFLSDIAQLWNQDFEPGQMIKSRGASQSRICVSLWNCAEAAKHLPTVEEQKKDQSAHAKLCSLVAAKRELMGAFSGGWNTLDKELEGKSLDDPKIKAIHYTDMRSQPQLRHAIPRLDKTGQKHWFDGRITPHRFPHINALFDELLEEAEANGYKRTNYLKQPFGAYNKRTFT